MLLIIDGFNLIYKFPELEVCMYENRLQEARLGLLARVQKYRMKKGNTEVIAFFDGRKEKGSVVETDDYQGITIRYSHELKADVLIKKYVKTCLSRGNVLTVTSDKDILFHCRKYGIPTNTSEDFAKKMNDVILPKTKKTEEKDSNIQLTEA
ncbi:MAG: NYN domain-containing protein, partial [Spirochaetota bacterium]